VEAVGFFLGFVFVDRVVAQVLEGFDPFLGDAEDQVGFFGGFVLGFGAGFGFHFRIMYLPADNSIIME